MLKDIFSIFSSFLPSLFLKVYDHCDPFSATSLCLLRKNNLLPDNIVIFDIGSNEGNWTRKKSLFFPRASFYLFDLGDKQKFLKKLKKINHTFIPSILYSKVADMTFFTADSTGDSLYKEISSFRDQYNSISVRTTTIDLLHEKNIVPLPDYLKIDTQGTELDILKGATNMFKVKKPLFIELELSLIQYNDNAPSIKELMDFMYSHDYCAVATQRVNSSLTNLVQIDTLFAQKSLLDSCG